jgi:SAM-dependent methyltransferase
MEAVRQRFLSRLPAGGQILGAAAGKTDSAAPRQPAGARIPASSPPSMEMTTYEPARILDFGCGSGRDSRAFLDLGYKVSALDGSAQLCRIAGELTGLHVRCLDFRDYVPAADERYEGIWACASLLHLKKAELLPVLGELTCALVPGGILYVSFKYGDFEGERNGRYFTDLTLEGLRTLLASLPELKAAETWVTGDVRPGRSDERWLNALLVK